MIGLLTVAAAAATAVLLALSLRTPGLVSMLVAAYVVYVVELTATVLVLSPARLVGAAGVGTIEAVFLCGSAVVWWRRGRPHPSLRPVREGLTAIVRDPFTLLFVVVAVAAVGYELFLGLTVPANDYDGLTYHLVKAAAWAEHGGYFWVPNAPYDPINDYGPIAEQQILFYFAAVGKGLLLTVPQLLAEVALLVAVFGTARRLGFGVRPSAAAGCLLATFALVGLEASTAQNDLVAASLAISAAFLILGPGRAEQVLGGVAIGLALGVKLTSLFVLPVLAALALIATLYHCINHALMKSLLFLGTGSVLHATGERNLGRLGGLIHRMPWVAWLSLIGALAIAGLPPLNGFVSEWLLLQSFLFADQIPHSFVNMLIPMGAALVALCAALAAYVMVKFFGVIFLGQARESALNHAHDCGLLERIGLSWLAAGCVLLGLAPVQVLAGLAVATRQLVGAAVPQQSTSWWLLAPVPGRPVSYSALVFLTAGAIVIALTVLLVRFLYPQRVQRGRPWDCGFGGLNARMQDTAEGFGQPIRNIFQSFFRIERELPTPFDRAPRYRILISDRIWHGVYEPIGRVVQRLADAVAVLQQGRIAAYLLYSFVTLTLLLALALVP